MGHVSAMWPPERVGGLQGASPALNLNQLRPPCLPTCPKTPSKPQPAPPPALPLGPWPWQFFAGCQVPGDLGLPVATGLDDPASSSPPAPTKLPEQALQQGCTAGQGPELCLGRTSRLGLARRQQQAQDFSYLIHGNTSEQGKSNDLREGPLAERVAKRIQ